MTTLTCPRCHQPITPAQLLNPSERGVLVKLALGQRTRDVAHDLYISVKTVEAHVVHMRKKLGLPSQARLIAYAWQSGFMAGKPGPEAQPGGEA